MRLQSWLTKAERVRPRAVTAENVYALRDAHLGRAVVVAAPGPSFQSFPADELRRHPTIGVNAALELFDPTYWVYAEPFFTKKYRALYLASASAIVTTRFQALSALEILLPADRRLYWFRYGHAPRLDKEDNFSVLKMARPTDGRRPWWALPDGGFLPGRCSVATHAVSLAVLMGAASVVTVGVDFRHETDATYYAPGVSINPGPRRKAKALACGRSWAYVAAKRGVWSDARVLSISPAGGFPGARRVTVEEAISILRDHNT